MEFVLFSPQMSAAEQLDLFSQSADSEGPRFRSTPIRPVLAPAKFDGNVFAFNITALAECLSGKILNLLYQL